MMAAAVEAILSEVRGLANRGDHQEIVNRYGDIDDTPEDETWNSTELLFEIGRAFGMLGDEQKLERYLLRCAELAPRRAAVFHCSIGWYFQRKKKWTKALRWYDRALESFPTYHLCLFRRGYCLEKLHRPREAADVLTRARGVWETAPSEQRQRGLGVQVQVLFHVSRALRDLGDFDGAAEALETCRQLVQQTRPPAILPEHILACRGELELRRGAHDAALATFHEARTLDPTSSYIWERLGRVHELRGDIAAADQTYQHATTLPRGAFAFFALGRFRLHVTGDLPGAAKALAEALRRLPSAEPLVRLELARLHLALGRPSAAHAQVERALACRREGGFGDALRLASDIAERVGRFDEALAHLQELTRLNPEDRDAAQRVATLSNGAVDGVAALADDPPLGPEFTVLSDTALNTPGHERVSGVVDRFFSDKGFGFLRYGEGQTLFFHVTQCLDDARDLQPGTPVTFLVGHNPKKGKPQAESVARSE